MPNRKEIICPGDRDGIVCSPANNHRLHAILHPATTARLPPWRCRINVMKIASLPANNPLQSRLSAFNGRLAWSGIAFLQWQTQIMSNYRQNAEPVF